MALFNGSVNLTMKTDNWKPSSNDLDLTITGSTSGYSYEKNDLDLFMLADPVTAKMNLFVQGFNEPEMADTYLNLFVMGAGDPASQSLDLVMFGAYGGGQGLSLSTLDIYQLSALTLDELEALSLENVFSIGRYLFNDVSLYILGEGETNNFIPHSGAMNLFLHNLGVDNQVDLFIAGRPEISEDLDLSMSGVLGYVTGNVSLYLFPIGNIEKALDLFIRGFNA